MPQVLYRIVWLARFYWMARTYFVYILASETRELYVGVTNNLTGELPNIVVD
jgi:hypothetical protein